MDEDRLFSNFPSRSTSMVSLHSAPALSPSSSISIGSSISSSLPSSPPRIVTTKTKTLLFRPRTRSSVTRSPSPPSRQGGRSCMKIPALIFSLLNALAIVNSWRQLRDLFAGSNGMDLLRAYNDAQYERSLRQVAFNEVSTVHVEAQQVSGKNTSDNDAENSPITPGPSFVAPGERDADQSLVILTGLIENVSSIANSTLSQLVELNCQYHVVVHLLTTQASSSTTLQELRDQYDSCAPFVTLIQNKDVKILFPNRIDRIAYLRDAQRQYLYDHFFDSLTLDGKVKASILSKSVVIVMDFDLTGIPTNDELFREVLNISRDPDGADILCASGQMMNPPGYYDIFATILTPQTFVYPVAGRLVEQFIPGENKKMVRSNDIYGSFTQLDLLEYFENEARVSLDGTVPVKSCFGGLTMYRASTFFEPNCKYSGYSKDLMAYANKDDARPCEHVAFHDCLLKNDLSTYIAVKPSLKTLRDEPSLPRKALFSGKPPLDDRLVTYKTRPNNGTKVVDGAFEMFIDAAGSLVVTNSPFHGASQDILWRIQPDPNVFHEDWDIMFFQLKPNGLLVLEQQVKRLRPNVSPSLCQIIDENKGQHACRLPLWSSGKAGLVSNQYVLSFLDSGDLAVKDVSNNALLWSSAEDSSEANNSTNSSMTITSDLTCIGSGDETVINSALNGVGAVAALCPGSVFRLKSTIVFTHDHQKLYTQGVDADDTVSRALIIVDDPSVATAVSMVGRSYVELTNVVIDGNRKTLGHVSPQFHSGALIDAGGTGSVDQLISGVKAYDPRSWACVHVIEGPPGQPCRGAVVENSEIGPAGSHSIVHNEIADGISYACTAGVIRNNVVEDATDGGIVLFGAPGTVVEGNTIRANTRTMLGGINMVDSAPYDGNYVGTIVRDNVIDAKEARIHVGLGMGSNIWQCPMPDEQEKPPLYGGVVVNNTLTGDNMAYGFAINGVKDWTVLENHDLSKHVGEPTLDCNGRMPSAPGRFQIDRLSSKGTFQKEFEDASLNSIVETLQLQELIEKGKPDTEWRGADNSLFTPSKSIRVEQQLELTSL